MWRDDRLHGVAHVADHVDQAQGGAGVAASDVDDAGPVGALADVEGEEGNAQQGGGVVWRVDEPETEHGGGGGEYAADGEEGAPDFGRGAVSGGDFAGGAAGTDEV